MGHRYHHTYREILYHPRVSKIRAQNHEEQRAFFYSLRTKGILPIFHRLVNQLEDLRLRHRQNLKQHERALLVVFESENAIHGVLIFLIWNDYLVQRLNEFRFSQIPQMNTSP